jgi:hypothetical protein
MPLMALKIAHSFKRVNVHTFTFMMNVAVVMKMFWGSVTGRNFMYH